MEKAFFGNNQRDQIQLRQWVFSPMGILSMWHAHTTPRFSRKNGREGFGCGFGEWWCSHSCCNFWVKMVGQMGGTIYGQIKCHNIVVGSFGHFVKIAQADARKWLALNQSVDTDSAISQLLSSYPVPFKQLWIDSLDGNVTTTAP